MAFDADGTYLAATIDLVQDIGAYPIPWPVFVVRRRRDDLPRPVPTAERDVHHEVRVHQHAGAHRLPRAVAVRDRRPRDDARHRRPPPRRRPRRPAPPQPAAQRRDALRQRGRHDLHRRDPARDVRPRAREDRLRRVPPHAGRGARRGPLPRHRDEHATSSRRRAAWPLMGSEGATIRVEPTGSGQRVPRRWLGRQQPGDDGDPADRRCARRRHLDRAAPSRATRRSRRTARAPAAAAAARWSPVPSATRRRSCATGSRRSPPTCSKRRPTTSWSTGGLASVKGSPSPSVTMAEIADLAYFGKDKLPADDPDGPRGERPLPRRGVQHLGERHPRVHVRGRHRDRPASSCCATSSPRTAGR